MRLLAGGHVGSDAGVVSGILGLRVRHEQSRLLVGTNSAHLAYLRVERIQPSVNTATLKFIEKKDTKLSGCTLGSKEFWVTLSATLHFFRLYPKKLKKTATKGFNLWSQLTPYCGIYDVSFCRISACLFKNDRKLRKNSLKFAFCSIRKKTSAFRTLRGNRWIKRHPARIVPVKIAISGRNYPRQNHKQR